MRLRTSSQNTAISIQPVRNADIIKVATTAVFQIVDNVVSISQNVQAQAKVINKNSPVNDSKGTKPVIDRTIFVY